MDNWTENQHIITILNYLGYTKCSNDDKIEWLNCKNIERLEKISSEYHPLYKCDKQEPLFKDSISFFLDWDRLIKICIELNITNITTNKKLTIELLATKIKSL